MHEGKIHYARKPVEAALPLAAQALVRFRTTPPRGACCFAGGAGASMAIDENRSVPKRGHDFFHMDEPAINR